MFNWIVDNPIKTVASVAAILIAGLVYLAVVEQTEWNQFSAAHDCRVIARKAGTTGYGLTSSGKMGTVYISGTTTYHCNDGVDYTR